MRWMQSRGLAMLMPWRRTRIFHVEGWIDDKGLYEILYGCNRPGPSRTDSANPERNG